MPLRKPLASDSSASALASPRSHPLHKSFLAPSLSYFLSFLPICCPFGKVILQLRFTPVPRPVSTVILRHTLSPPSDTMASTRVLASRLASQMGAKVARPAMRTQIAKRTITSKSLDCRNFLGDV
jgi:hypothetical protein